jgi:hypothetical protein
MVDARQLYEQAWEKSASDYEACIAAHYMARLQAEPSEALRWNQEALRRADAVGDGRVKEFYPSLYLNMGSCFEILGNSIESQKYYSLAAELGIIHQKEH